MTRRPTIYEVARDAGVSIASVSRVLHGQDGVSEETRDRVRAVIDRMGYVANGAARGLARQRLGLLGFVFADLDELEDDRASTLYVHEVVTGAERSVRRRGDAIVVAATHSAAGRERVFALAGQVDGLAVMAGSVPAAALRQLSERLPVVVFAAGRAATAVDSVRVDNRDGAQSATRHLLEHGYADFEFLGGPSRSAEGTARFAGFSRALADAGHRAPDRPRSRGDFTERGGFDAMRALLGKRRKPPRAVVAGNDQMAIGAVRALVGSGLSVPQDVAVVGFDDISLTRHVRPPLTTVRQPMRAVGQECARLLQRRFDMPDADQVASMLPTELVVRQSCGCTEVAR